MPATPFEEKVIFFSPEFRGYYVLSLVELCLSLLWWERLPVLYGRRERHLCPDWQVQSAEGFLPVGGHSK